MDCNGVDLSFFNKLKIIVCSHFEHHPKSAIKCIFTRSSRIQFSKKSNAVELTFDRIRGARSSYFEIFEVRENWRIYAHLVEGKKIKWRNKSQWYSNAVLHDEWNSETNNSNEFQFVYFSFIPFIKLKREWENIHLAMCGAGWIIFWWFQLVVCVTWNRLLWHFGIADAWHFHFCLNVTRNFTTSISWKSHWFWPEKQSQSSTKRFDQILVCNEFIEPQQFYSMMVIACPFINRKSQQWIFFNIWYNSFNLP